MFERVKVSLAGWPMEYLFPSGDLEQDYKDNIGQQITKRICGGHR